MKYLNKIIEYGLYLLVFLLPLQTRYFFKEASLNGFYFEYTSISLYAIDVLLIFLFFAVAIKQIKENKFKNKFSFFWWPVAVLDLFAFISIFFAINKSAAIYGYARLLLGIAFFFIILKANYSRYKLLLFFLFGSFIQAIIGICQFLFQKTWANPYLGWAGHSGSDLGASIIEVLNGGRWLRAYGGLDHPNVFGGLMAISLILVVCLVLEKRQKTNIKVKESLYYFFLIIFSTALFFSFSRAAITAFLVSFIILFINFLLKKDRKQFLKLLKLFSLFCVVFIILTSIYSELVISRLSQDTSAEIKSINERVSMYHISKNLIENHWLIGTGINNYGVTVEKEIQKNGPYYFYQPVHNVFVLVLVEIGLFGFLAFASFIFYTLYIAFRRLSIFNFSIISIFLIIAMLDHWLWSLHFGVLLFWLILGIILKSKRSK